MKLITFGIDARDSTRPAQTQPLFRTAEFRIADKQS